MMKRKICLITFLLSVMVLLALTGVAQTGKTKAATLPAMFPVNGSTLPFATDDFFTFLWNEKFVSSAPLTFVLVPLYNGQKPAEAIKKNKPIYSQSKINDYYINYPWNAPELEEGNYAWQVLSKRGMPLLTASFTIGTNPSVPYILKRYQNQYMYLKEIPDGSYQIAYDKQLWIHYDEPYFISTTQGLRFKVFDKARNLIIATDETGMPSNQNCPVVAIQEGENWVKINLSAANVNYYDYYALEVWDGKGEKQYLRFKCASSLPFISDENKSRNELTGCIEDTADIQFVSADDIEVYSGSHTIGNRTYELTDHLGNVMAVISDRKIGVDTNHDNIVDYYKPEILSVTDYYPYGYPMAERSENLNDYRYGFNGQEADGEIYGEKQSYTFEYRMHDTRLGRFWSVDPLAAKFPWNSTYAFAENSPIGFIELEGLEKIQFGEKQAVDFNVLDEAQVKAELKRYHSFHQGNITVAEIMNTDNNDEYWEVHNCYNTYMQSTGTRMIKSKVYNTTPFSDKIVRNFSQGITKYGDLEGHNDGTNHIDKIKPALYAITLFNPLVSITNDITILTTNKDIFENKTTSTDKIMSIIGLSTIGTSHTATALGNKTIKIVSNIINKATMIRSQLKLFDNDKKNDNEEKK